MELKEGYMSLKDLSVWFGFKPNTLPKASANVKAKRFDTLSTYADFHFEGNRLYIDKVIIPRYSKALEIIEEEMPKCWGKVRGKNKKLVSPKLTAMKVDTCARVGCEIFYNNPEVSSQISLETTRAYTNKIKIKNYGRCYLQDDYGERGHSEYVWLNITGTDLLPEEQLEVLKQCAADAYQDTSLTIAAIEDDYKHHNISKEERDQAMGAISTGNAYERFQKLAISRLGFMPVKRTRLYDDIFWEKDNETL